MRLRRSTRIVVVLAAVAFTAAASPAGASFAATDLFLPSVGSAPGTPPSVWYTTVWVFNPNAAAVTAQFSFLPRDHDNSYPVTHDETIGPGELREFNDIVATMFGVQGFGAIRVVASEKLHVLARIYSKQTGEGERDSVGQLFPGLPAQLAIGVGQSTDLLAVITGSAADYRYNVGFLETSGKQVTLGIEAWTDVGTPWISTGLQLRAYEPKQMSVSALFSDAIGDGSNFRIRVTPTSGEGRVIVFGSRVANGSQDPTTIEMTYPDGLLSAVGR